MERDKMLHRVPYIYCIEISGEEMLIEPYTKSISSAVEWNFYVKRERTNQDLNRWRKKKR